MTVTRRLRFVYALTAWLLGTVFLLTLFDALTPELLYSFSLVGLFVVIELTAPFNVTPRWRKRLRGLIIAGLLGLGFIILRRTLQALPEALE
jgi:hypothetical protein